LIFSLCLIAGVAAIGVAALVTLVLTVVRGRRLEVR